MTEFREIPQFFALRLMIAAVVAGDNVLTT